MLYRQSRQSISSCFLIMETVPILNIFLTFNTSSALSYCCALIFDLEAYNKSVFRLHIWKCHQLHQSQGQMNGFNDPSVLDFSVIFHIDEFSLYPRSGLCLYQIRNTLKLLNYKHFSQWKYNNVKSIMHTDSFGPNIEFQYSINTLDLLDECTSRTWHKAPFSHL